MDSYVNFVNVLGEEYIKTVATLARFGPDLLDGYRIFAKVYGPYAITVEKLQAATDSELEDLKSAACQVNGTDQISAAHIRQVIRRTLARWSANPSPA